MPQPSRNRRSCLPQPVPDRNGVACSITLRPPALGVLPMSAAGFVAACQHRHAGGLGQFPGRQVKDFPRCHSP
ncbi:hypothetical protein DZG01_08960 [Pseudomonas fluorescens]|nr:hypothetical protein DZG01_08960 [Pseudomonas fluorescens]